MPSSAPAFGSSSTRSRDMETVGEAGNVDEAIAETRALDPDLVLLDLTMPGKPGLTRRCRSCCGSIPT